MTHEIIFADVYCVVSKIQNPDFRCHVTQELNGPVGPEGHSISIFFCRKSIIECMWAEVGPLYT